MAISLIRSVLLYVLIILAMRLMGKRQVSDMQTSELVVTFLISDIASIPMQNTSQPLLSGIVPIAGLICCEIFFSLFMMKNRNFRKLVCGSSSLIIKNGQINQKEMQNLRMSVDDLMSQLRQMNVFSLEDVAFAIMETNGQLSVLKKSDKQPPDAATLGITVPNAEIDTVLISNGYISNFSLNLCNLTKEWLDETLKKENVRIEDIFIMTANKSKKYTIIKKEV